MKSLRHVVASAFVLMIGANTATAASIAFELNDFVLSTSKTLGVNLTSDPASAPALPADGTFTVPVSYTPPLDLDEAIDNVYLPQNTGKFLRFTFTLPAGYSNLSFELAAAVNDEFAVYLNDVVVAMQATTSTENFVVPLPGFQLNAGGTATDPSTKLDYLMTNGMQSLFHSGLNELTVFATDTLAYGGITHLAGVVNFDTRPPEPVPAPATLPLLGFGIAGLVAMRRRSHIRQESLAA
jgi:PEP-CTERM motif